MMRKLWVYILLTSGLVGVLLWAGPALAQSSSSFHMEKSTIDGGGGRIASSSFVLQGTTGQMEAGSALASSSFRLAGGFWPQAGEDSTPTPDPGETPTPDPEETPTPEGDPPSLFIPSVQG